METIETILSRKSVRSYKDISISDKDINTILSAGMAGPSAVNARPFEFIVITDKDKIKIIKENSSDYNDFIVESPLLIMVVANQDKFFKRAPDYWIIDCSIAAQNLILAARDLGIGSCWMGLYPQMEKVKRMKEVLSLPENIIPHSLISFGYPKDNDEFKMRNQYESNKVHFNKW